MLYATCPTCNNLLADKQIFFEEEKEKIENDKNLSKKDREREIEKLLDKICTQVKTQSGQAGYQT